VTKKKLYDNKNHGFFIMPKYRSIDINDLDEIKIVGPLLKRK
jgi:CMP-N-acetylneuraminic acid synthetase